MNFREMELNLLYLGNAEFTVFNTASVGQELKTELMSKVFPSGSKWRLYIGTRSIAFFPLKSLQNQYALAYSIVIDALDMPLISFVTILSEYRSKVVLNHGLRGIENTYLRKIGWFYSLHSQLTGILIKNIVSYKSKSYLHEQQDSGKVTKQARFNQAIFSAPYKSPYQWLDVESAIIKNSAPSKDKFYSFRSFTLNPETEFDVLGIVQ